MSWVRDMLAYDGCGLALLHGQAFFVLGFSIVFLTRRSARLEVARGLLLLAAFGFCEALAVWMPMLSGQEAMNPSLAWLRLLLLGGGYAFLLAFSLQAQLALDGRRWGRWIAAALFTLWLTGMFAARRAAVPVERVWLGGEFAARYLLALPGGLLGAFGLSRQVYRTIGRERASLIKPYLRIAGISLGIFALFGGLVGPSASFFPASLLNQEMLLQTTGVPVSLLRGLCGVALTYGVVRSLGVFLSEIDHWIESVERRQALASERERIGRELHDGIIQSIYAAGLILEGAQHSIPDDPEAARVQLARAIDSLNRTIKDIRRYIFNLRGEMPDDDLETGLKKILRDFRINTLLETEFSVNGDGAHRIGAERRQHIFQIAREALANVARHAQARRVEMDLQYGANALQFRISDDGVGLSALPIDGGHGLRNIRERARLVDGMLDIDTAPKKGFTLILTVPY